MIAQFALTLLLSALLFYAAKEARKSPIVGAMTVLTALVGLYVVWVPQHAGVVAEWAGIGRGADLILYVWAALSLIIMLNLHLKLRGQLELITALTRSIALAGAKPLPDRKPAGRARERTLLPHGHDRKRLRLPAQQRTESR